MSEKCDGVCEYGLVAVKRDWCPEWLFRILCNIGLPWFGQLILYPPFSWIIFRRVR